MSYIGIYHSIYLYTTVYGRMDKDREDGRCFISSSTYDISHVTEYGPKTKSYTFVLYLVSYTQSLQEEDIIVLDFN